MRTQLNGFDDEWTVDGGRQGTGSKIVGWLGERRGPGHRGHLVLGTLITSSACLFVLKDASVTD